MYDHHRDVSGVFKLALDVTVTVLIRCERADVREADCAGRRRRGARPIMYSQSSLVVNS